MDYKYTHIIKAYYKPYNKPSIIADFLAYDVKITFDGVWFRGRTAWGGEHHTFISNHSLVSIQTI